MDHHQLFTSPSPRPLVPPTSVYDLSDSEILEKLGVLAQQASFCLERLEQSSTAAIHRIKSEADREIQIKREELRGRVEHLRAVNEKIKAMESELNKMKKERDAAKRDQDTLDQQCRDRIVQRDNDVERLRASKYEEQRRLDPRQKKEWMILAQQLVVNRQSSPLPGAAIHVPTPMGPPRIPIVYTTEADVAVRSIEDTAATSRTIGTGASSEVEGPDTVYRQHSASVNRSTGEQAGQPDNIRSNTVTDTLPLLAQRHDGVWVELLCKDCDPQFIACMRSANKEIASSESVKGLLEHLKTAHPELGPGINEQMVFNRCTRRILTQEELRRVEKDMKNFNQVHKLETLSSTRVAQQTRGDLPSGRTKRAKQMVATPSPILSRHPSLGMSSDRTIPRDTPDEEVLRKSRHISFSKGKASVARRMSSEATGDVGRSSNKRPRVEIPVRSAARSPTLVEVVLLD